MTYHTNRAIAAVAIVLTALSLAAGVVAAERGDHEPEPGTRPVLAPPEWDVAAALPTRPAPRYR